MEQGWVDIPMAFSSQGQLYKENTAHIQGRSHQYMKQRCTIFFVQEGLQLAHLPKLIGGAHSHICHLGIQQQTQVQQHSQITKVTL